MNGFDYTKRILDVAIASVLLVLFAPVAVVVAAFVRLKIGRPVLFTQDRCGLRGKTFRVYKFRSMMEPDPGKGRITDAQRLTPLGIKLRSSSLDELPTLLNVIKGDMSLVGPRPLLVDYLKLYSPEQSRRHEVRPGITGLAQISGRNAVDWQERFRLDVEYVDRRSFALDLLILIKTLLTVLRREGISEAGQATMSRFMGNGRLDSDG